MDSPETLGRFQIERELGRGAMGVVYIAEDPVLHRRVAIKAIRIHPGLAEDHVEELRQRFVNEARAAANLSHPNIVTIYDAGFEADSLFIAMELVEGESLDDIFDSERLLTYKELADLALQLGSALDHAHEHGVVHRDIKPANVLIDRHGKPKIADFGVARQATSTLTATGTIIGTPAYMSPEQITGHAVTGAADQFSLGIVLYEALTGLKPFHGDGATTVLYKIVHEEPTSPMSVRESLPPEVDEVVLRALAKDPADRYSNCTDLAEALRNALKAAPAGAGELLATGAAARTGTRAAATAKATSADARTQLGPVSGAAESSAGGGKVSALPLNLPTLLAAAAAVLVIALGLVWVLSGGSDVPPEPLVPEEPPVAVESATPSADSPEAQTQVQAQAEAPASEPEPVPVSETFRIVSRPDGAQVTVDGRVLAERTPVEVSVDASSRHTLLLELPGRESVSWAFVPEELPEQQRQSGQLFFPMRDAAAVAAASEPVAHDGGSPAEAEVAPLEPYDPVKLRSRDTPPEPPDPEDRVNPVFPDWAAEQGLPHYVILEIVVDKQGRVRDARTLRAVNPELERLAHEAVLQWHFKPALRDGNADDPIDAYFNLSVTFDDSGDGGGRS